LVLDEDGYVKVTDFGIAREYREENLQDVQGTPSYMAPEVLNAQNHGYESDYYALGVVCHEMVFNRLPHDAETRQKLKEQILAKKIRLAAADMPGGWNPAAADFLNQCLQRQPRKRLGQGGGEEIYDHAWFAGFDWDQLKAKKMKAPYIPGGFDNFDKPTINRVTPLTAKEQHQLRPYQEKLDDPIFQARFASYHFERPADEQVPEIKPIATPTPAPKAPIEPQPESIFA
jgi:serum/glucocorticoid-regulated kinase 2